LNSGANDVRTISSASTYAVQTIVMEGEHPVETMELISPHLAVNDCKGLVLARISLYRNRDDELQDVTKLSFWGTRNS
jgi:hypothetical protein